MANSEECHISVKISQHVDLKEHAESIFLSRQVDSDEDILEILRSLEEIEDESFPYYTLIRWLRSSIEEHLEECMVTGVVQQQPDIASAAAESIDPEAWRMAANEVYNNIMEAPQMVNLLENIRMGIDASDGLARDLLHLNITPSRRASRLSMCESDSSMDDSWWAHSVMPQQYQQLAEDISSRKAATTRIEALKLILGSQVSEAAEGQYWSQLRRGLREALCDDNDVIFSLGLKIHAKLLTLTVVHVAVKEAFINLIESVSTQYMSRKMLPHLPTLEKGIDLNIPLHFRLMKILKLISDAQKEIPKDWIRFSSRKIEEIIGAFVDLLAMHTYDGLTREKYLYPFHLLSIIDFNASWSLHWTHSVFSRQLLLGALGRSSTLLRFIAESILKWMEDFDPIHYLNTRGCLQTLKENTLCSKVPTCLVQYTVFTSSIIIFQSLLPFEMGRSFFPISNPDNEILITINSLAISSVEFLNNHIEEIGIYGPVTILVDFISSVLQNPRIMVETSLVLAILQPVLEAHADKSQEATYPQQIHTVKLIQILVSSEDGVRCLMGGRKPRGSFRHRNSSENLACLARMLGEYLNAVLKGHRNADAKLLDSLLGICSNLNLSHDLFLYLESTGLFHTLNSLYKFLKSKIDTEMLSPFSKPFHSYCSLLHRLTQCYLQILKTPKGILYCEKDGILYEVMQELFENSLLSWQRPNDRVIIAQVCCFSSGAKAIREERVVAEQLMRVWQSFSEIEQSPGAERRCEEVQTEAVEILACICSSVASLQVQLSERTGSEETLLALGGPCTLPELLEATLLEEEDAIADTSVAPPSTQVVHHTGLTLLSRLVTCPDSALLVQSLYNMQENLIRQQRENASSNEENSAIIIDELSILRNHILVQVLMCGGPSERVLPPPTMPSNGEYPFTMFSVLPPLKEYSRPLSRSVSKKQGELQKFLADTRPGVHDAQWLMHCRRAAKSTLAQCSDEIRGPVMLDLVKQVLRASPNASLLLGQITSEQLVPEDLLGISLTIRYGAHLRLIQSVPQMHDQLGQLIKFSRTLKPSRVDFYTGFDWLVASVFLIMCGNFEKCQNFLQSLAALKCAPLVWSSFAERRKIRYRIEATFSQLLELVLSSEDPQLLLAFKRSGLAVGSLACNWLRRCFWGILDWPGVTQWLALVIASEPDLSLYLIVALLMQLKPRILTAVADGTLTALQMDSIEKINMSDALAYVEKVSKRHRHKILPHLQAMLSA